MVTTVYNLTFMRSNYLDSCKVYTLVQEVSLVDVRGKLKLPKESSVYIRYNIYCACMLCYVLHISLLTL